MSILIELQMQPDRLMPLRVLEYLVQIWKHQVKQPRAKTHRLAGQREVAAGPARGAAHRLLFLGAPGLLLDLMDDAEDFREATPAFQPLFVSLPERQRGRAGKEGRLFRRGAGPAQGPQGGPGDLRPEAPSDGEQTAGIDRPSVRLQELLDYVEALVYHARAASEHDLLISASMPPCGERGPAGGRDGHAKPWRTFIAKKAPWLIGSEQPCWKRCRLRFGAFPAEMEQAIQATQDAEKLAERRRRFATANDLDSIGIVAPR